MEGFLPSGHRRITKPSEVQEIETALQVVGVDGRREKNDHTLQIYFIKGCLFVSLLVVTGLAKPKNVGHLRTY
jgi:hypothetical protein